jgi:parvulin-like peptidyl-prolyl isomerase
MTQILTSDVLLREVKLSLQFSRLTEEIRVHKTIAALAEEKGIKPDVASLQKAADQIRVSHNLKSAAETYEWLEKYGLSMDDFEELALRSCLKQQLAEHLFADKIEPYFVQHKLDYMSAVLYEVVFDDEDLAMEAYYALQAGETTFPQVAHDYIRETEVRRRGGYLGKLYRTALKPEVAAAVFLADPPQVLKPILSAKGISLILVETINKPLLNKQLFSDILMNLFSIHINEYRHKM